ncbi:MAG: beta-hydroxyacyl-ACP dehydratase [Planctomycetota bacterium]
MAFDLLDEIVERSADRLVAEKRVDDRDDYLRDHFPSFAILPGVMMLETLVQAGRRLAADRRGVSPDAALPAMVVAEVRKVTYAAMVRPGQTLVADVKLRKVDEEAGVFDFEGVGTVEGREAVKGRFRLRDVDPAERLGPGAAAAV